MTFETWMDTKRNEAFIVALENLVNSDNSDAEIEEGLQAENDVMRALHAHGLLP